MKLTLKYYWLALGVASAILLPGAMYLRAMGVPFKSTILIGEGLLSEAYPLMRQHGEDWLKQPINLTRQDFSLHDTGQLPDFRTRRWIIQAGGNDLIAGRSSDEIGLKIASLIDYAIRTPTRYVYVLGVPPMDGIDEDARTKTNVRLETTCAARPNCQYVFMDWATNPDADPLLTVRLLNQVTSKER